LRPVLSPVRIQFLDNTHSPNLSWTLHFDPPPLVCSCVCVCVCVLWDLWIGCCVCTILVCALAGEWSGQCWPPAMMSVRRQARGWSGDACVRHVGNARNAGWKKLSAILRNSNSSPHYITAWFWIAARGNCVLVHVFNLFHLPRLDEAAKNGCSPLNLTGPAKSKFFQSGFIQIPWVVGPLARGSPEWTGDCPKWAVVFFTKMLLHMAT
jgi:hypothetical protein